MGLCKCPKKKVTNLFCYEHRVNVCQHCMVKQHSKCIVQSYLLWLQDSDYDPNCVLCGENLVNDECVRLICLHIFHWKCLESKCRRLPSTTAPAGYKCPICREPIFPLDNVAVPVAEHLRSKLCTVNWARLVLGLPTVSEKLSQNDELTPLLNHQEIDENHSKSKEESIVFMEEPVYSRPEETAQMPRRIVSQAPLTEFQPKQDDEIKDRRGNAIVHFTRYFCRRIRNFSRFRNRRWKLLFLVLLAIVVISSIFGLLGHLVTDDDPTFDPIYNPHIHLNKESS